MADSTKNTRLERRAPSFAAAPTNLTAVQKGPTSIRVSWTPPTSPTDTRGYRIHYSGGSNGSVNIGGRLKEIYSLTGLQNGANYTVSIVGTSQHLPSEPINYPHSIPLIPGLPVTNVSSTTATTISLWWNVPNSRVESYVVGWERDTSRDCTVKNKGNKTLDGSLSNYTIKELEEDSTYMITLKAINAAGSTVGEPVIKATSEAVPSAAPTSVRTSNVTFSNTTLQWEAVECIHQNGNITGYSVCYWIHGSTTPVVIISEGSATSFNLMGLLDSTTYHIAVAAMNNAGTGLYSDPITLTTMGTGTETTEEETEEETEKETEKSEDGKEGKAMSPHPTSDVTSDCTSSTASASVVAGCTLGGFVGGLITAVLGAAILVIFVRRMRTKLEVRHSLSKVVNKEDVHVATLDNLAYGCVKGVGNAQHETHDMAIGTTVSNQEFVYDTIPN